MKDYELLKLAADAAGLTLVFVNEQPRVLDDVGYTPWNPLIDNGQALTLAVKLRMIVSLGYCMCCAVVDWSGNGEDNEVYVRFGESFNNAECETAEQATRLAIVRAAAKIQSHKEGAE